MPLSSFIGLSLYFVYLISTVVAAFRGGESGSWPPVIGFAACAYAGLYLGYQPAWTLLYVKNKKALYLAAQAVSIGLLLWFGSLTGVVVDVFDVTFPATSWIGVGLAVAAFNGFTTPPPTEEVVRVNKEALELGGRASPEQILEWRINAYGALLERFASCVAVDTNELPCSKDEMKAALQAVYGLVPDDERSGVKMGYIQLSMFQEGVGSEPVHDILHGLPENLETSEDSIRAARQIVEMADTNSELTAKVDEEKYTLLAETESW